MSPQVVGSIVTSLEVFYGIFGVFWFWHKFRGGTLGFHKFVHLCSGDLIHALVEIDNLSNKVNRDTFYRNKK